MDPNFWHDRWAANQIAFHQGVPNPLLVDHFQALALANGERVFLPMCGKTRDIHWLLSQGYRVAGAELSEVAIQQLFAELGVKAGINDLGGVKRYSAPDIDVFVGNIFDVTAAMLGRVDATYDRAALVALPAAMRVAYTRHLREITGSAKQLLITFEYDQNLMDGPPFSLSAEEIDRHYEAFYDVAARVSVQIDGGLKGRAPATENVWLLNPL